MHSEDCSTDSAWASLRAFAATLPPGARAGIAGYVLASLLAAFAAGAAALLLVPLIQPAAAPLSFAGGVFGAADGLGAQALAFAAAMAAFAALRWCGACLGARLTAGYGLQLRRQVHARLVGARLEALAGSTSAEIANVLTYNVEVVVAGFGSVLQLLVALLTTVVTLAIAAWISPSLLLALPMFAAFAWMAAQLFGREQARIGRDYVADMTRLFWRGEDFPRRLRHVRSFGRQQADHADWSGMALRLCRGYRRQLELAAHGRLLLELLASAAIAAGFLLAHRWSGIDQAALVAVCLLLARLLPYLASTRQAIQQLRTALPAFGLWRRYMALEPDPPPGRIAHAGATGTLRIRRLVLPPSVVALEVGELVLAPGELTLVCGDSGIGKSCLVDVLAGMSAPARFEAEIAGRPIAFDDYRGLVERGAYLSQQVRAWHASVRDCLRWAAPAAGDAAMWEALDAVGLADRVDRYGRGLDLPLQGPSSRLSGGELQRLLLAQLLLRQPVLAILDEATGALDAHAEMQVLQALRHRLPDAALVVVSHRAGLAALADQTVEVDGGGVAVARRRARALPGTGTNGNCPGRIRPGRRLGTTP